MTKRFNIAIVSSDDDNIRLDKWFKRNIPEASFTNIVRLIRKGIIKLNGKKAEASTRVISGDELSYPNIEVSDDNTKRKNIISDNALATFQKSIVYEDKNMVIISKPSGVAVQGGTGIKESIDEIAIEYYKAKEIKPKLVHRIDKETSGILMLAKSANVAAQIAEMFRKNTIKKTYLAIVEGVPKKKHGTIEDVEIIEKNDRKKREFSRSEYRVLDYAVGLYSLFELKPESGRKHQLRKHCLKLGHPIIGDAKYGKGDLKEKNLYLHAYKIEFTLPSGEKYNITCDLHKAFKTKLHDLGLNFAKNM